MHTHTMQKPSHMMSPSFHVAWACPIRCLLYSNSISIQMNYSQTNKHIPEYFVYINACTSIFPSFTFVRHFIFYILVTLEGLLFILFSQLCFKVMRNLALCADQWTQLADVIVLGEALQNLFLIRHVRNLIVLFTIFISAIRIQWAWWYRHWILY